MIARAAALLPDVVGVAAFSMALAGVYDLWGRGWTLLVGGGLVAAGYVWREARTLRRRR